MNATNKFFKFAHLAFQPRLARRLVTAATSGYLQETGWLLSAAKNEIVDAAGMPIPWATLPFVDFLLPKLQADWCVFEYGSGASSLSYASRVAAVLAVEHDAQFAQGLSSKAPGNLSVLVRPLGPDYIGAISEAKFPLDMVSVDGRMRVECVRRAIPALSARGFIVLDDSERPEYTEAHRLLREASFKTVEFWGMAAGRSDRKCTQIFYREGNVLNL